MQQVTTILTKKKVTKNTVRYDHPQGEGICPAVYLSKKYVPQPHPEAIELTIGFPEGAS